MSRYEKYKETTLNSSYNWRKNNKDHHLELKKAQRKRERENISDSYCKKILRLKGFSSDDIQNKGLIEVQRILTKTKRLCKT